MLAGLAIGQMARCKSAQQAVGGPPPRLTLEQFTLQDWQRQVEYLESIAKFGRSGEDDKIIGAALTDDDSGVVVASLQVILKLERDEHLPAVLPLLKHDDAMIRWQALLIVEKLASDQRLITEVARLLSDKEWLVRETAYRTLRKYSSERKTKNYFYTVLLNLKERNTSVVVEIYRTLVWYDDESAWPYVIKRSYHCKSASELILVMRELARTKTREAQVRLKTLTRSQSVIVRQEANELLREYF
jgi:HEAT repeat protein